MSEQFLDTSGNSNPLIIKFEGIDYWVRRNCKFMGLSLTFLGIYDPLVISPLWIASSLFLLSEWILCIPSSLLPEILSSKFILFVSYSAKL